MSKVLTLYELNEHEFNLLLLLLLLLLLFVISFRID